MSELLLEVRGLSKAFPGVQALSEVDFDVRRGEVHALVGENGAGKSTLTRIVAGVDTADAGRMSLSGAPYAPSSKAQAEFRGVRMVMQELNLIPTLTVAENIFLRELPSRLGFIRYRALNRDAAELMRRLGLDIDPATPVATLGTGQQQMVEIAAGLSQKCRLLALDEPTASLTDREIERLFEQIRRLRATGVGIIYISHRLEEIQRIADRVTVLRDGRRIDTRPIREVSTGDIVRMMVGRDLVSERLRPATAGGEPALRVVNLTAGPRVRGVTFEARRGQILGFAGLMGSGRTETMRAIFGADRRTAGRIYLRGSDKAAKIRRPADAVRLGIALLTEDRKEQGLFLPLSVRHNVSVTNLRVLSRLGWISRAAEDETAARYCRALTIRCASTDQPAGKLSGGNQQKVVIAKWLFKDPEVLIFDEPTRGIDVGAKFEIYRLLGELAEKGKAVVMVSSDLIELMAVCDRIAVMSAGRLAATFDRGQWSQEAIMTAALSEYVKTAV